MTKQESLNLLESLFLICPHTGEKMTIDTIEGKDSVILVCSSKNCIWKFEIKIEEL